MCLDADDLRHLRADRRLDLLRDVVRLIERKLARQLQVERDLDAPVDVEDLEIVELSHVRDGERGGENAFAECPGAVTRLDVDYDVDPRQRLV